MTNQAVPPTIGKYKIVRPLGRGGMGQVYLAEDTQLQRKVAIKCLRPELNESRWQENLKREALVLARLNHPNIVHIHDIVEYDHSLAIVTEYVEGQNLHIVLRERKPDHPELSQWLAEIAAALDAAHQQGISHNDLKPENILIGPGNVAKINDFGIASTESDLSADILAFGQFAAEMCGDCADRSPLLDHLVQRMQDKRPGKRPDAGEVALEMRHIWLETTQAETPLPPGLMTAEQQSQHRIRRRWTLAVVATVLVLSLVAYLGLDEAQDAPHKYVAVLPARLDIDEEIDSKKYALLASSVQQGLYQAVMGAPGYSLVSPAETGQQDGTAAEIGSALRADELLVPQLKCVHRHCELSTERLVGPDFRMREQRSTALLPELTLEAHQIATRQWKHLYRKSDSTDRNSQSISEDDYRRFLVLYEGVHRGGMPLDGVLAGLDQMFASDVRFLPATELYVFVALDQFYLTRERTYLERARGVLRETARWSDDSTALRRSWFSVALESGDFVTARQEIARLEESGADEAMILSMKGSLHAYQGDYTSAGDYFSAALKLRPTRNTYASAAHAFYYAGEADKALSVANTALVEYRDESKLTSLKGLILLERGDLDAAIVAFRQAVERRPNAADFSNLGLAYLLQGKYGQAHDEFIRAMEVGSDGRTMTLTLNLADSLALQGRMDDAKALYQSLASEHEQSPSSVRISDVAQALAHLGQYQSAIQLLDTVQEKTAETHFAGALVYALAGQSLAAIAKVHQALEDNMGYMWFRFPWFDSLCEEPDFARMMETAGDADRCQG